MLDVWRVEGAPRRPPLTRSSLWLHCLPPPHPAYSCPLPTLRACLPPSPFLACRYDHQERLTAREALDHPWLAPVREFAAKRRAEEMGTYPLLPPPSEAGGGEDYGEGEEGEGGAAAAGAGGDGAGGAEGKAAAGAGGSGSAAAAGAGRD
jgi:hypothetical protein